MATRTITNGGGVWTTASTWVENQVPTAADDVVATASSGPVVVSSNGVCRSLDLSLYTNQLTINSGITITIGDSGLGAGSVALKFSSSMTFVLGSVTTSKIVFASTNSTTQTITTNGKTGCPAINFTGSVGANYQFTDNYSAISGAGFILTDGTLNLNGKTLTFSAGIFNISGSNLRTLTATSSTIYCGTWTATTTTNLTFTSTGSTIGLVGSGSTTFNGGGLTYVTVTLNNTGTTTMAGTNTFTTLTNLGTGTLTLGTACITTNLNASGGAINITATQTTLTNLGGTSGLITISTTNTISTIALTGAGLTLSTVANTLPAITMTGGGVCTNSIAATVFSGGITCSTNSTFTISSSCTIATNTPLTTGSSGTSSINAALTLTGGAPVITVSSGSQLNMGGTPGGSGLTITNNGAVSITANWGITLLTNNSFVSIATTTNTGITTLTGTGTVTSSIATTVGTVTLTGSGAYWSQTGGILTVTTMNLNNGGSAIGLRLVQSTTHVISTITTNATTATGPAVVTSAQAGTTTTISMSGTSTTSNLYVRDITKTGAGTWTLTNSLNWANNTGMTFTAGAQQYRYIATTSANINATSFAVCDTVGPVETETSTTTISTSPTISPGATLGIQTLDGIAVCLSSRVTSPTGTFSVTLRNITGSLDVATVTVNVADLASGGGWHFFKFASSQTTLAATSYGVKVVCSVASEVVLYSTDGSTNIARLYRTTTTSGITNFSQLIVMNELTGQGTSNAITVTMNATAATWNCQIGCAGSTNGTNFTNSIAISGGGTFTWGTSSSTAYNLNVRGNISVWSTWNRGTSDERMPGTSTATLNINCTTSANVEGSFIARPGSTVNNYGATLSNTTTNLTQDYNAASTSLNVTSTTGWAAGDVIILTSTTPNSGTLAEQRTISSVNSSVNITVPALTNAHSGTSIMACKILHMSRNVKTTGANLAGIAPSAIRAAVRYMTTSTVNDSYVEFKELGSGTTNTRGIDIQTTTGSYTSESCAYRLDTFSGSEMMYLSGGSHNNITISDLNIGFVFSGLQVDATSGTNITLSNIRISGGSNTASNNPIFTLGDVGINVTNVVVYSSIATSGNAAAIYINEPGATQTGTISGLGSICGASYGMMIGNSTGHFINGNIGIDKFIGATNYGILINFSTAAPTFNIYGTYGSSYICGNQTYGIHPNNIVYDLYVKDIIFSGLTTAAQPYGIILGSTIWQTTISNCDFGIASGLMVTHSGADILPTASVTMQPNIKFRYCTLASNTELSITGASLHSSQVQWFSSVDHDKTRGNYFRWDFCGTVQSDLSLYRTAAPSLKMTPNTATYKLRTCKNPATWKIPIASGQAITLTCYVYKSASYNGSQPRLIAVANSAIGITSDTVLATASGGTGSWLTLSGTTSAATANGVLEFYVDCDGTAGTVNVDDFTISGTAIDTTGLAYQGDFGSIIAGPTPLGSAAAAAKLVGFGGGLVG